MRSKEKISKFPINIYTIIVLLFFFSDGNNKIRVEKRRNRTWCISLLAVSDRNITGHPFFTCKKKKVISIRTKMQYSMRQQRKKTIIVSHNVTRLC